MSPERISEEKAAKLSKPDRKETDKRHEGGDAGQAPPLAGLQQMIGNRAVQRLIAQRSSEGPAEIDDETAGRINQARGGGQSLDRTVQKQMGVATGHDFSSVRVHTSPEADDLNRQLGAKAFTTGRDVFFREGAYDPHSSGGQELIAHELTHVVQQGSGVVGSSGGGMTVNAPGDAFEQEADAVAKQIAAPGMASGEGVQRQEMPEEEELQMQPEEEEEEEMLQPQPIEEEEELAQTKAIQRQEELPEEEL